MKDDPKRMTDHLKAKCPYFPPISTAASSVTQVPGFFELKTGAERDDFEMNWLRVEAQKWYVAMDSMGQVYKMRNPAVARHPRWQEFGRIVVYVRPTKYEPTALDAPETKGIPEQKRLRISL